MADDRTYLIVDCELGYAVWERSSVIQLQPCAACTAENPQQPTPVLFRVDTDTEHETFIAACHCAEYKGKSLDWALDIWNLNQDSQKNEA